jgi:hypothetical protein
VAGIAVRRFATAAADRAAGPIAVLATVLLVASAVPIVIGVSRTVWSLATDGTILGLGGFAAAGFLIGHVLGGPERANRLVLGLATATRHPAVALAIAHANFPEQGLASAAVFLYVVLAGLLSALYLLWTTRTPVGRARALVLTTVCMAAMAPTEVYGQDSPPLRARASNDTTAATVSVAQASSAIITKTYAPILGTGVLFGTICGWAAGRWGVATA